MKEIFVRMIELSETIDDKNQELADALAKRKFAVIYRDATKLVWEDSGSGAHRDGSIWTLDADLEHAYDNDGNPLKGFKLLGDRACNSHEPCGKLLLVKDISFLDLMHLSSCFMLFNSLKSSTLAEVAKIKRWL